MTRIFAKKGPGNGYRVHVEGDFMQGDQIWSSNEKLDFTQETCDIANMRTRVSFLSSGNMQIADLA